MEPQILEALPEDAKKYIHERLQLAEAAIQRSIRQKESNRRRQSEWYERNAEKKCNYAKQYYLRKKNQAVPTVDETCN